MEKAISMDGDIRSLPGTAYENAEISSSVAVHMGTILCAHCGDLVDTFDAEKVVVYYGSCEKKDCGTALQVAYEIA